MEHWEEAESSKCPARWCVVPGDHIRTKGRKDFLSVVLVVCYKHFMAQEVLMKQY
jgi:hypothetical protein